MHTLLVHRSLFHLVCVLCTCHASPNTNSFKMRSSTNLVQCVCLLRKSNNNGNTKTQQHVHTRRDQEFCSTDAKQQSVGLGHSQRKVSPMASVVRAHSCLSAIARDKAATSSETLFLLRCGMHALKTRLWTQAWVTKRPWFNNPMLLRSDKDRPS